MFLYKLLNSIFRKLHLKTEDPNLESILEQMSTFGLELDHIETELLKAGDRYQIYFFLDLLNVLIDSIFQAKQNRIEKNLKKKLEKQGSSAETSGGEEISKILEYARKTYGRVHSFRKEFVKENNSLIKPQKLPVPGGNHLVSDMDSIDNKENSETSLLSEDLGMKKSKIKTKKSKPEREKNSSVTGTAMNESEHEINVKIPTSDTTAVMVKVKPLDNRNLKNKRIHVRINQKVTPDRPPQSQKILYGRKSVISHHLRKTRPPMFSRESSRKTAATTADRKQLLKNVIDFVEEARREEACAESSKPVGASKERLASLHSQKMIREGRTKTAQLRKLVKRIN